MEKNGKVIPNRENNIDIENNIFKVKGKITNSEQNLKVENM